MPTKIIIKLSKYLQIFWEWRGRSLTYQTVITTCQDDYGTKKMHSLVWRQKKHFSYSRYFVAFKRSNLFLNSFAAFFSAALMFFMEDAFSIERSIGSSCSSSSLKSKIDINPILEMLMGRTYVINKACNQSILLHNPAVIRTQKRKKRGNMNVMDIGK